MIATIITCRPFTLPYAKKQAPEDYWDTVLSRKINHMISGVWAAAFTFSAAVGLFGDAVLKDPNNFWTGWVLQLAALFFAVAFTEFYPDYAGAQEAAARGEDEAVPSVLKLFDWLPLFILIAGIFGWVTDALPDAVGIGMIVVGVVGSALVRKFVPSGEESTARASCPSSTTRPLATAPRWPTGSQKRPRPPVLRCACGTSQRPVSPKLSRTTPHGLPTTRRPRTSPPPPAMTSTGRTPSSSAHRPRFGSPASQFRNFIDTLGGLWAQGKLADRVYAGFTSSQTEHLAQRVVTVTDRLTGPVAGTA